MGLIKSAVGMAFGMPPLKALEKYSGGMAGGALRAKRTGQEWAKKQKRKKRLERIEEKQLTTQEKYLNQFK